MKLFFAILLITFPLWSYSQLSDIVAAEYFFDTDPGIGAATALPAFTANSNLDVTFLAASSGLSEGMHILGIRVQDNTTIWSIPLFLPVYVLPNNPILTGAEYFFDTDPGFGNGIPISITAGATIDVTFAANSAALGVGMHSLVVRTRDANGDWGIPVYTPFFIDQNRTITKLEYFFDTDPGSGNGTAITVNPATDVLDEIYTMNSSALAIGGHNLHVRVAGQNNFWSMPESFSFSVIAPPPPTITSFSPTSGPVGTLVTITGNNFSTTPANNIVYFGAVQAVVSTATSTQLTVTVPPGSTYQPITVSVNGLIAHSHLPFIVTFAGGGSFDDCSFAPAISIGITAGFTRSAFADIDGDGKPDLLVPYSNDDVFAIFRNVSTVGSIASTSFEPKMDFITGDTPFGIATGDLDGDGKPDIAVINYRGGQLSIYKNVSTPGNIILAPKVDFTIPDFGHDVWIADIDGDGKQDLTITTSLAGMTVLRNTTTTGVINASSFAPGITFATGPNPNPFALGDMDGDGKLDAAIPNANAFSVSLLRNTSTSGIISFAPQVLLPITTGSPVPGAGSIFTTLGDIDDDGKLDLVVTTNTINAISLFHNTSTTGTFSFDPQIDLSVGEPLNKPVLSDLDGDGKIDLVADFSNTGNLVYKNQATPGSINASSFSTPITFPKLPSRSILLGDVDGDGRNDIITTSATIQILQNLIGTIGAPVITSFSPLSGSVGTTVTINGNNFSTYFTTSVAFNGTPASIQSSTANTITVLVPVGATTGLIQITVGCNTIVSSGNFSVGAPATIIITQQPASPNYACEGASASFTTAATGTSNITYQWQKFDGSVFVSLANNLTYSGVTSATLTVSNVSSAEAGEYQCVISGDFAPNIITNTADLIFNSLPSPPDVTNGISCGPGAVTLTASGGGPGNYRWYSGSPLTLIPGEEDETFVTPSLSANTTYYVSIVDTFCESVPVAVMAIISSLPIQPTITSTISPVGNALTICSSTSLTLSAPNGFTSYIWSNGATTSQINISSSGSYSVIVTDGSGCSSPASTVITVTVVPAPCNNSAPVINNTTLSTTIGNTVSIDLSTLISDADNNLLISSLTILQQPSSGAPASLNGTTLQINYSNNSFTGIDVITIRVCDVFGECATQQLQINVIGEIEIFNAVSHNNDGKNDFFKIQNIELLEPENTVTIYNRWGSKVFETKNYSEVNAFRGLTNNGNELPSGTYFYKILLKSTGKTETGYLILRK